MKVAEVSVCVVDISFFIIKKIKIRNKYENNIVMINIRKVKQI